MCIRIEVPIGYNEQKCVNQSSCRWIVGGGELGQLSDGCIRSVHICPQGKRGFGVFPFPLV